LSPNPKPNTQHPIPNTQYPTPNTQYPTPNQIVGKSKNTESGKQKLESNPVHPVKSLWENRRFYLTG